MGNNCPIPVNIQLSRRQPLKRQLYYEGVVDTRRYDEKWRPGSGCPMEINPQRIAAMEKMPPQCLQQSQQSGPYVVFPAKCFKK